MQSFKAWAVQKQDCCFSHPMDSRSRLLSLGSPFLAASVAAIGGYTMGSVLVLFVVTIPTA